MAICSNQEAPESSSSPGGPTSADIKRKLMEVLDNLNDTASIASISKTITQPSETAPRLSRLITLIIGHQHRLSFPKTMGDELRIWNRVEFVGVISGLDLVAAF